MFLCPLSFIWYLVFYALRLITRKCSVITHSVQIKERSLMLQWVGMTSLFWCQLEEERALRTRWRTISEPQALTFRCLFWHSSSSTIYICIHLQFYVGTLCAWLPAISQVLSALWIFPCWLLGILHFCYMIGIFTYYSVFVQLPALICPGVTLVISPLVSLIQDQIMHLLQASLTLTLWRFLNLAFSF